MSFFNNGSVGENKTSKKEKEVDFFSYERTNVISYDKQNFFSLSWDFFVLQNQ
jgi:hypothetical protein